MRRWMASGVPASRIDELERALLVHVSAQAAARSYAEAGAVLVAAMDDAGVEVDELADALSVSTSIVHKWRQFGLPTPAKRMCARCWRAGEEVSNRRC